MVPTVVRSDGRPRTVTADNLILVGIFDGFSWIRSEGKGSFMNSPAVKSFGDARIAAGETCVVVDLGGCPGMDSTFMGTLAGMASRISALEGGVLQIADPGERNRRSLEDLGLDFLLEIDPPESAWRGRLEELRCELAPPQEAGGPGSLQRAHHVLEAHQTLSGLNDKNAEGFKGVVTMLSKEVEAKEEALRKDD